MEATPQSVYDKELWRRIELGDLMGKVSLQTEYIKNTDIQLELFRDAD